MEYIIAEYDHQRDDGVYFNKVPINNNGIPGRAGAPRSAPVFSEQGIIKYTWRYNLNNSSILLIQFLFAPRTRPRPPAPAAIRP